MRLACGVTTERGLDWTALSIELSEDSGMMDLAHKFTANQWCAALFCACSGSFVRIVWPDAGLTWRMVRKSRGSVVT